MIVTIFYSKYFVPVSGYTVEIISMSYNDLSAYLW